MAIARVQSGTSSGSGTAPTITLGASPTNGNTIIALIVNDAATTPPPVADTIVQTGVTWTRRGRITHATNGNLKAEFWHGAVGSSPGTLITFNKSYSAGSSIVVIEYSGVGTSKFIHGLSTDYGNGTFAVGRETGGFGLGFGPSSIGLALLGVDINGTFSNPSNGYSIVAQQIDSGTSNAACITEHIVNGPGNASLGTQSSSCSIGSSNYVSFMMVLYDTTTIAINKEQIYTAHTNTQGPSAIPKVPTTGNTLVLTLATQASAGEPVLRNITQTGVEWVKVAESFGSSGAPVPIISIWVGRVVSAASATFNLSIGTGDSYAFAIVEYNGVQSAGAYFAGMTKGDAVSVSSVTTTGITSAVSGDVVFVCGYCANTAITPAISPGSSFSRAAIHTIGGTDETVLFTDIARNFAGAPTSISTSLTMGTTTNVAYAMVALSSSQADSGQRRQHATTTVSASTTAAQTVTLASAPQSSSSVLVLLVGISQLGAGENIAIDTSSGLGAAGVWTKVADSIDNPVSGTDNGSRAVIFICTAPSTSQTVLTINTGGASAWPGYACLIEYLNRHPTSPVAQIARQRTNSNTTSTGSVAITAGYPRTIHVGMLSGSGINQRYLVPSGASGEVAFGQAFTGSVNTQSSIVADKYNVTALSNIELKSIISNVADNAAAGVVLGAAPSTTTVTHTTTALLKKITNLVHTTTSLLRLTTNKTHTTNSILRGVATLLNSSDALLRKTSIVVHLTDMFIRPPERAPELRSILTSKVPASVRAGQFDVNLLGMSGNEIAGDKFVYTVPSQEFVLEKSQDIQLDVVDPIIKKVP